MFPPKKKKLGESMGFGGEGAAPPKYKSGGASGGADDKPAASVAVEISKPKPAAAASDLSAENHQQEGVGGERAEQSGSPVATPESVNYRTEGETCQACEYMQGSDCTFLRQPVGGGDSCNRFEAKAQDMLGGGGPGVGMDIGMEDGTNAGPAGGY